MLASGSRKVLPDAKAAAVQLDFDGQRVVLLNNSGQVAKAGRSSTNKRFARSFGH